MQRDVTHNLIPIILLLTTVEQLAIDIYLPSLPAMTKYFGVTASLMQQSLTIFLVGFALSPLLFGPLSDKLGRRIILIGGIVCYFFAALMCLATASITWLLMGRFIQGIGSGAIVVANQSMVRDTYNGKHLIHVAAYMSMTWSLVPIIAPAIGGYIQYYFGWQTNFLMMALYAFVLFLYMWATLPETNKHRIVKLEIKRIASRYYYFLSNKAFMAYVCATAITFAVTIAFNTAAPFLFQVQLGLSPVQFGWLVLAVALSYLCGTFLNSVLVRYFKVKTLLIMGQCFMLFFSLVMLLCGLLGVMTILSIAIPASLIIFFEGFVYPNAAALAFDPIKRHTGVASALYSSIQLFACALASAIIAKLPETNQVPLALVLTGFSALLLILYYTLIIRIKN